MVEQKRKGFTPDVLISIVLFVAVAGHAAGFWTIPRWDTPLSARVSSADFDPQSVTVAYLRAQEGGVSPWDLDATKRIMTRLTERWAEATLGRSRITLMDSTDLRDVLVMFMPYRVVPDTEAVHMALPRQGARSYRLVQVFTSALRSDIEFTSNAVLHELAHAMGCCQGAGTIDGHWAPPCRQLIMCVGGQGTGVRTFSEGELGQMGLGR